MMVNLEILGSAYLVGNESIENLNTKELVPKMVFRRRLTKASKVVIELMNKLNFTQGRIMYGSAYGELEATSNILASIANQSGISPTDFQNSVYNTAASYASILYNNKNEIMTISCGDETSEKLLKLGAIKALDGDELMLIMTETMHIDNIAQINHCINYLECGVALKIRVTQQNPTINMALLPLDKTLPKSVSLMMSIAQHVEETKHNILSISL